MDARRHEILRRLNAFDAGPTEDDRRAERRAEIKRVIETERDLKGDGSRPGSRGACRVGRRYPSSARFAG
jgi:hypothetical protein